MKTPWLGVAVCRRPLRIIEQKFNLFFVYLSFRKLFGVNGASGPDQFVDFRKIEAHRQCLVAKLEFSILGVYFNTNFFFLFRFYSLLLFIGLTAPFLAQFSPSGFQTKLSGEDITYFSPFRSFANQALLTRCNGVSPIEWEAQKPIVQDGASHYQFLIGFSNGTSGGDRLFDVYLNDSLLFTFETKKSWVQQELTVHACNFAPRAHYRFTLLEKDINRDMFGYLELELPNNRIQKSHFKIVGRDMQSRDWLMVFKYQEKFDYAATASNLVLRETQMRPLNLECVIPAGIDSLMLESPFLKFGTRVSAGYRTFSIASYPKAFSGQDTLLIQLYKNGKKAETKLVVIEVHPTKNLAFHIIHHSHNDIGYSHLQTEVAKIQTENIRAALRWIAKGPVGGQKPIWHIESLWAVENFLTAASAAEEAAFVDAVKAGQFVLSANYANCLTGLMRPEEFSWLTAYAKELETKYGLRISNAMVTDIPGQSYAAFEAYTQQQIPYLSLGPNYVQNLPDHGDRVGGVVNETGDRPFMWHPIADSSQKLFVWTAGKGYSYFHNVAAGQQFFEWEKRISAYTHELENYPYELVQLRYTKNADNGPVDTMLCEFIAAWNLKYSSPQLQISNLDTLFKDFLNTYQTALPLVSGEISPYWEDGAYSTAAEEIQARRLVKQVIDWEAQLSTDQKQQFHAQLREIHRNLILFHEHTWGAWCSISAPDTYFTTEQWRIKKAFLDSAQVQFLRLDQQYRKPLKCTKLVGNQFTFTWDSTHSGIRSLRYKNQELLRQDTPGLGACVYSLGIAPQVNEVLLNTQIDKNKCLQTIEHPNLNVNIQYVPTSNSNEFILHYTIDKKAVREKEALHICLPFDLQNPTLTYGDQSFMNYAQQQLPGSNKEFICVPDYLVLEDERWRITIFTPDCNLIELGAPIDETQTAGAKVWKRENQAILPLYLYVFNNYWHTNYKADQSGVFEVNVLVRVEYK